MANRLKLDFSLSTNEERAQFLNEYLQQQQFVAHPPTHEELETMGNYVLWGKDPKTGLNAQQDGTCTIDTKHDTWRKKDAATESLDGLIEMPTFNEASLHPLGSAVPAKVIRETFSRKEALAQCPPYLVDAFTDLFRRIDELDLAINYYELAHNRRKNPPRPELLRRFTDEEQLAWQKKAETWTQYHYLKQRHQLVELRREQYTLRDAYSEQVAPIDTPTPYYSPNIPQLDSDIVVLPLGVKRMLNAPALVFRKWDDLVPTEYSEKELQMVSDLLWSKKNCSLGASQFFIDFRELEHVYQLFQLFFELDSAAGAAELESSLPELMDTLAYYIDNAELSEVQREILDMKLRKVRNADIALAVNKKWNKTYTANYISTIFRQRIIPKINAAAAYHEKVVSNLFFEEEFKTCTKCGRTLLCDPINFTRKARSKDGYTTRCKKCEKEARQNDK